MKLIIHNIKLSLDDDINALKRIASKKLKVDSKDFIDFKIVKESIDARKKPDINLIYSVMVETARNLKIADNNDIRVLEDNLEEPLTHGDKKLSLRPVVIGTGPAGLFAALILSQNGYKPLVLERGECVEKRTEIVNSFWKGGELNPETNVQFGEGGAGTFSDGKLTTRINDRRCTKVLQEFYASGAQEEILYKAKPHIGTDVLKKVVVNMRKRIIDLGGEVRFNSKVTSVCVKAGKVTGVVVNNSENIDTEVVILATGHSARDTYSSLFESGIEFVQKPFSVGVRIEHPQELINKAQYGEASIHPRLGAADYQLFYKTSDRTVYSFCMCPGGIVVASASEPNMIVTNGMSEFARDRKNANSALVVSVGPGDFGGSHPLAGIEFQRMWERLAFGAGGSSNAAPVQRLEDFIDGRVSSKFGAVCPSYTGETRNADINTCLPGFVTAPMKESIKYFDDRLKGFGSKDALLTGVETRTSSPVRIPRTDTLEATRVSGLYPTGEGAGYAGGIVSAAVDGIRVAEQIIKTYSV
ncbi:NAD(P)/FAD-dependent oxidoreductase [Acetivibrio cellulolyticus]|uniref:NAD(P)/FAD-dependent oxidoreductase n=1 Tax=Acetivibrio cellulolyticus TaxID=35830 RepID=UPI0001E2FB0D|nr:FAD-dependent oxidoreductase [Acetivibrio cellulolyticus]